MNKEKKELAKTDKYVKSFRGFSFHIFSNYPPQGRYFDEIGILFKVKSRNYRHAFRIVLPIPFTFESVKDRIDEIIQMHKERYKNWRYKK